MEENKFYLVTFTVKSKHQKFPPFNSRDLIIKFIQKEYRHFGNNLKGLFLWYIIVADEKFNIIPLDKIGEYKFSEYLRIVDEKEITNIRPFDINDLPLYLHWKKTPLFDYLLKGEK